MRADGTPEALETHPARFQQVGDGSDGFTLVATATADQHDKFAKIHGGTLRFAWCLLHRLVCAFSEISSSCAMPFIGLTFFDSTYARNVHLDFINLLWRTDFEKI